MPNILLNATFAETIERTNEEKKTVLRSEAQLCNLICLEIVILFNYTPQGTSQMFIDERVKGYPLK